MTAVELIEKLKQLSPETRIIIAGYEGGYNDIDRVEEVSIDIDSEKKSYYGRHRENESGNGTHAVALTGSNLIAED